MEPPYQLKKMSNEGSASPFVARIFMAPFEYRNLLADSRFTEEERTKARGVFDHRFTPLLDAAQSTRDAAREVISLVTHHRINIASKRMVKISPNQYEILETIDTPLGQAVDKVLIQGTIAIKTGLQNLLTDFFDLNIGLVFQKPKKFEIEILKYRKAGEDDFADYLFKVRKIWLTDLMTLRNKREHEGQRLEHVQYGLIDNTSVGVFFPKLLNLSVEQFAQHTANRVLFFIENTIAYAFQRMVRRTYPIGLAEISPEQRDPSNPQRFRLFPIGLEPSLPWRISYREDLDFV